MALRFNIFEIYHFMAILGPFEYILEKDPLLHLNEEMTITTFCFRKSHHEPI